MHFTRQYDRNPVSFAIFAKIVKVWDKKNDKKKSLLKFILQFLTFFKRTIFFLNSVESSEFVNSVT